ncbi:MAG: ATP synthase subunit I [Lachnospiraceae bacterium]|jgi:hypothetical protein|nr:ATP synthase subunit I [Lachnospiraceae bacterium]
MKEKLHPTLIELWIGIAIWSGIAALSGVWFCKDKPAYLFGVLFGCVAAMGLSFYMLRSVSALVDDLDAGRGDKRIRASAMVRLGISAAVIAIACVVPFFNPIGTFLGILSTKFAAYSNPLIHKITPHISDYFKDKEYPPEEESGFNPGEAGAEITPSAQPDDGSEEAKDLSAAEE